MGFLGGLGAFGAPVQASTEPKTRFYVLEQLFMKNGTQMPRVHEFVSKAVLPALSSLHEGPKIYLEALVAPHMPQFAAIYGFESLDQLWNMHRKVLDNADLRKKAEEFESGPEAPFENQTSTLIEAASYSPEIVAPNPPPPTPRIFELRTYHSPTWRQLGALHDRFAGPEIRIFDRCGVHPILYGSTVFGSKIPNLTYVIPFASLAEREKAWNAFAADPEWVKVRKESIDKHGQISSVIEIALYRAAPYSPIR